MVPQLYVAGNLNAGPLQRWTGTSWSVVPGVSWNFATRWSLAVHDDGSGVGRCLYLGGSFFAPDDHLARWNGSQWIPMPGTLAGNLTALSVFREAGVERLFVAGPSSFNGSNYGGIARWNGSTWSPLGFGVGYSSGTVLTMQPQDDGNGERLFLGGTFLNMGGFPASGIARFGEPCGLPVVTSQPQSVQLQPEQGNGSTYVGLSIQATGTQPLSYQWLQGGVPLTDSTNVYGATLPSIELYRWTASTAGDYTCAVTNGVGTTYSQIATVSIPQGPAEETWEYPPLFLPPRAIDSHPGATAVTFTRADFASDGSAILLGDIDQNGSVASGRFSLFNGTTTLIARAGMAAPQCEAGAVFQGNIANSVLPAAGGKVAFLAPLSGFTLPDGGEGIFHFDGTQLALVARSGATLPGLAPGETVRQLSVPGAADTGLVAFRAKIFSGNTWLGTGLWSWTPTTGAQLELRTGQAAPGSTAIVQSFESLTPQVVTPDGRILIDVLLNTNTGWKRSIVAPNDVLVLLGPPGALQKVVQSGDVSPGFPPVCNFEIPWAMLPTARRTLPSQLSMGECLGAGERLSYRHRHRLGGTGMALWLFKQEPDCYAYSQLEADGRTLWDGVSNALALKHLQKKGLLKSDPLIVPVAAISCGIVDGQARLDLDYEEDSSAEVDANIIMTADGQMVEVQASGEESTFSESQLAQMLALGKAGIHELVKKQQVALGVGIA